MAALADRVTRVAIIPVASLFWAATMALSGFIVANAFQLFWTNAGTGFGQAYRNPCFQLVDQRPLSDTSASARLCIRGPGKTARPTSWVRLAIGLIVAIAGGEDGWRWAFYHDGYTTCACWSWPRWCLKEPPRGKNEQAALLEDEAIEVEELEASMRHSFGSVAQSPHVLFLCHRRWRARFRVDRCARANSICCLKTNTQKMLLNAGSSNLCFGSLRCSPYR